MNFYGNFFVDPVEENIYYGFKTFFWFQFMEPFLIYKLILQIGHR
jgi:hypothetical protein